jgi:DNA-binding transcriptional regulator GbsR (MarR family)
MDCADVAEELGWSRNGASKVLADVWRENYVRRRQIRGTRPHDGDFEYQIFEEVTVE